MRSSVADQDALIAQLKAANVHVIRAWFSADDKGIDFAKRVYAQGIKIELGLDFQYPPDAPKRAYQPQEFPNMWGGHPLSYADPTFEVGRNRRRLRRRGAIALSVAVGTEAGWRRSRAGAIAAWWSSLDLCRQASVGR
jgi:hypothetical protein